jgi:hypothetical protein
MRRESSAMAEGLFLSVFVCISLYLLPQRDGLLCILLGKDLDGKAVWTMT